MPTEPIKKKILVVDDDKAITTMLNGLLTNKGYSVLIAYDGLDGMVQVRKHSPGTDPP